MKNYDRFKCVSKPGTNVVSVAEFYVNTKSHFHDHEVADALDLEPEQVGRCRSVLAKTYGFEFNKVKEGRTVKVKLEKINIGFQSAPVESTQKTTKKEKPIKSLWSQGGALALAFGAWPSYT